jgi:hypothetical protein
MDARRFDSLTRRLGTRLSRRDTVRLGAGVVLGAAGLGSVTAAVQPEANAAAAGRFVSLAFYPFDGDIDEATTALKPLIRLMQQQPGFITMAFIEGDEAIYLVTTFLDKTTSDAGMTVLEGWLASDAQDVLTGEPERDSGDVFLRSEQATGCWCRIDDENACDSDELYCCAPADDEQGVCLTVATICPGTQDEESDDEEDPTPTPTATTAPTAAAAGCTSAGCDCVAGSAASCDDGLTCCGVDVLLGTGVCMSDCPCGSEGCDCVGSALNTCDPGLICCAPGAIGGQGTCQSACTCTSEGCACTTGDDGACDDGLSCCGIGSTAPGSIGACLTACATNSPCPGSDGCECGDVWKCNDGLTCCGATVSGSGICAASC